MFTRFVTKRNVLFFGLIGPLVLLVATFYFKVCIYGTGCEGYFDPIGYMIPVVIICFPSLFFSLITYKMRDEIFQSWLKFAIWWIPLTILFTMASSSTVGQGPGAVSDKGIVDIGMTLIFTVVSLIIIITKRNSLPPASKK